MTLGVHNDGVSAPPGGLPAPVDRVAVHPASHFGPPAAAFLSQLIAARDHMAPQRTRRRAPVATALLSYHGTAILAPPRLPPGYRKSLLA